MQILKAIFSLTILLCAANTLAAQDKTPKTVVDFYILLPAKYIQPLERVKNRKELIEVKDVSNGYLRLAAGGQTAADWEGWAEVALFKKTSGEYLIGVVDGECATICTSSVVFLEYRAGKWTEVTKNVLPQITNKMILDKYKKIYPDSTDFDERNPPFINFKLPQKGTTVRVNANEGGGDEAVLFELAWNGERFSLGR